MYRFVNAKAHFPHNEDRKSNEMIVMIRIFFFKFRCSFLQRWDKFERRGIFEQTAFHNDITTFYIEDSAQNKLSH